MCILDPYPWPLSQASADLGLNTLLYIALSENRAVWGFMWGFSDIYTSSLIIVNNSIELIVTICSLLSHSHSICHYFDYLQQQVCLFLQLFFVLQLVFSLSEVSTMSPFQCSWPIRSIMCMMSVLHKAVSILGRASIFFKLKATCTDISLKNYFNLTKA